MFALRLTTKWLAAALFSSFASFALPSIASDWEHESAADPRRMIVPAPVSVPAGKSLADVKEAINKSLAGRRWTGKETAPNVIEGTFDRKKNGRIALVVSLKYDTRQVEIIYKESKGLRYEVVNGEAMLHARANGWMKNLASDIGRFLAR